MIIVTRSEMAEFERFLADLKERLPQPLRDKLGQPHAANELLRELPSLLPPELLAGDTKERRTWEMVGILYLNLGRHQDGIAIFRAMLDQMFKHQAATKSFVHKGVPLVWLADCYAGLGCRALAKRFLMLTLCDDAIAGGGKIDPPDTGVYHRLVWQFGLSHEQVCRYADGMAKLASKDDEHKLFPEAVLLDLDQDWQTEIPTSHESGLFVTNSFYVRHLMNGLGDGAGVALERLAQYVMSCIPGLRVARRARSRSTDYDLVCAMDGAEVDFRSDFGRYFVCECKDWSNPVDFTSFAKFSRVLDSVKARFGVIFSKEGLTGSATTTAAVREQLKVYQDRGLVIVAIDKNDLAELANGKSLIALLRRRYEEVRLDLRET